MKRIVISFVIVSFILLFSTVVATTPQSIEVTRNIASMPLAFTANQGQWNEQVSFRANAGGATMWFTSSGATYQFTRTIGHNNDGPFSIVDKRYSTGAPQLAVGPDRMDHQPDSIESIAIKASFIGANPDVPIKGIDALEYKCNYFIGNDPNQWHTDIPNYSAVVYEQIYDGIDLKYYGNGRQMEYDFIVSPGADYSQIQIQYDGAESVSLNDNGELVVETKWGDVVEQRPVIYQTDNNSRIAVAGEYRLSGSNTFGFELGSSYDPSLPLVIDPLLSYSTYLGGSLADNGLGIAVDDLGNAYITGSTFSTDFPTVGAYQNALQGEYDLFVTKLNSSGTDLVYSTYIGGNGGDSSNGIAVDGSGNAYIVGATWSYDFPTVGAYQSTYPGGWASVFVTKLSSSGNVIMYSTFLGGSDVEEGSAIAVDSLGNAYVTGFTLSTDFPTAGAFQSTHQGGTWDGFVTKLNSSGNGLSYSTYLGGNDGEYGKGIAVDGSGNAYVIGGTSSTNFPTAGAYQNAYQGGPGDVFVTKLDSSGSALVYSTYLGGSGYERGYAIAVNGFGSAYVTGQTSSSDFPTVGAYQTHQGGWDVFVSKFSSLGNTLVYSTYLGGNTHDYGYAIAVDDSGSAYVTGHTGSLDFPTVGAYQNAFQGGPVDAFVTELSGSGSALVYSTYLGASSYDEGNAIAVDGLGYTYVTGYTFSTDFPTDGAYQNVIQGSIDVFVTKFTAQLTCCIGTRGDVNGDGSDLDIVDLTTVVDYLFGVTPPIPCPEESDVNGDGSGLPDIVDLTFIVDWLFGVHPTLVPCP